MSIFYSLTIILLIINITKTIFKDIYTWQRKEYLFYRMKDFLQTREGSHFLWDSSYWIKTIFLVSVGFIYFIYSLEDLNNYIFWILFVFLILDTFELLISIKLKQFRYPKFTKKALVLMFLTFVLIAIPIALFALLSNFSISLEDILVLLSSVWLISVASLLFTALAVLIFLPIDTNTKKKIYEKARNYRQKLKNLNTIAISGSYGKTTTKEYLYHLLSLKYKVEKTEKNQNADLAVARKILSLDPETEIFLCEIGTYRVGLGSQICKMALPNSAIITGLDEQHYNLFGSRENIIKAESESLGFLSDSDKAYINWSSEMCRDIKIPQQIDLQKYSLLNEDIVTDIKYSYPSSTFCYKGKKLEANVFTKGSLENLIAAITIAVDLGVDLEDIGKSIKKLPNPDRTLKVEKKSYGLLINDSRNINPTGVKNALESLEIFDKYKKVVILDEIPELGKESTAIHEQIARSIYDANPDLVILQGKSFLDITYNKLINLGFSKKKIHKEEHHNTKILNNKLKKFVSLNKTIILAEGFRSSYLIKELG